MDGKFVLITGATSGIGYYTAQELARMGASVVLVGRDESRCLASLQSIKRVTGNSSLSYLLADFSSLSQVRALASDFLGKHSHLDVLVNNAGTARLFRHLSADGFELTFAVNHLSHFLLTNLLLPALLRSPSARVLNVSSGAHYAEHLDFSDLQLSHFYNPWKAYGRSKLAQILFSNELSRRMLGTHVTSNALTPGMVATDIWKKVSPILSPIIFPIILRLGQPPLQGAQTSIYLASSPDVEGVTGKYFGNMHLIQPGIASYDEDAARRLWDISAQLSGLAR